MGDRSASAFQPYSHDTSTPGQQHEGEDESSHNDAVSDICLCTCLPACQHLYALPEHISTCLCKRLLDVMVRQSWGREGAKGVLGGSASLGITLLN